MRIRRQQLGRREARGPARLATAWLLAVGVGVAACAAPPDDELPPVRRVLLRPEQLAAELEQVQRGVLRQLPRDEFEGLVHRAAAAQDDAHNPPRLLEARYRAVLTDDAL